MIVAAERPIAGQTPTVRAADVEGVRQRLVVVGNGMAGARGGEGFRGGGGSERFAFGGIGEEPYATYTRLRLSNVLSGADAATDIFLNPLDWYAEQGIALRAGVRVTGIDRQRRRALGHDGT